MTYSHEKNLLCKGTDLGLKLRINVNFFYEIQEIFMNWTQVLPMLHEVSSNNLIYASLQLLSAVLIQWNATFSCLTEKSGPIKYFSNIAFLVVNTGPCFWNLLKPPVAQKNSSVLSHVMPYWNVRSRTGWNTYDIIEWLLCTKSLIQCHQVKSF